MKYLIYLVAIIVLFGINLGLFGQLKIAGQIPNLLFLLVLYFSLEKKDNDFLFLAFVCGLILDFYSVGVFGRFTFVFLSFAFILRIFTNIFNLDKNFKTVGAAAIIWFIIYFGLLWIIDALLFKFNLSSTTILPFKYQTQIFMAELIYNLLLLYPMFIVTVMLKRIIENLRIRGRGIIR